MTLTARDLAIAAASFGLAAAAFAPRPVQNPPAIQPTVKPLAKLANSLKLAAAERQLDLKTEPRGIRSLVELNPNRPCIKGLASLRFTNASTYSTVKEGVGSGSVGGQMPASSYNAGMMTTAEFKVVQPGKAHVLTFYVNTSSRKDFKVSNQTFSVPAGDQTIVYATIPAEAGWSSASLSVQGSSYRFYNVEIDVLD